MTSEWLDWVQAYLERDDNIVVPIKKMWVEWHATHAEPELAAFTAGILADDRFEDMGGVDHAEDMSDLGPEELEAYLRDMEALGYYSGPRVKLRAREITLEHIARMIARHHTRMEDALRQAHEAMPEEIDEQTEGMLIEAQVKAAQLREQLRDAGLYDDEAPNEEKTG